MKKTKKNVVKKVVAKKQKSAAKSAPKKTTQSKIVKTIERNSIGVTPLSDRVLVKPIDTTQGTTTSFGIIIPDTVGKEKPEQGTVVAVGPGKYGDDNELIPLSVAVGDRVMFSKYGYDEVKINGVEYYVLPESSILAILD